MNWNGTDIAVDSDMEVDCDIGQEITAYIETWFDVDKSSGSTPPRRTALG